MKVVGAVRLEAESSRLSRLSRWSLLWWRRALLRLRLRLLLLLLRSRLLNLLLCRILDRILGRVLAVPVLGRGLALIALLLLKVLELRWALAGAVDQFLLSRRRWERMAIAERCHFCGMGRSERLLFLFPAQSSGARRSIGLLRVQSKLGCCQALDRRNPDRVGAFRYLLGFW